MRTAVSIVICLQLAVVKIGFASSPFSVDDSSSTGAEQCFCQVIFSFNLRDSNS